VSGAAAQLSWDAVLAWRVARQGLAARAPARRWEAVVSRVCGLHAQVLSSAELTLWARVDGLARGAVERALWTRCRLVKTWAMRGTLHLLPASELPLWVAALDALPPRHGQGAWLRAHGLTRELAEAVVAAIPQALAGRTLTRAELAAAVGAATGSADLEGKMRGGFGDLLKPSAFRGDLVFASSAGQHVRFARASDWIGAFEPVDRETAIGEVVRRYLRAYGPATREWFARWFGMSSPALAGRWLRGLGDEVAEVDVAGTRALMLAADVDEAAAARPAGVVRLLPAFDQHVVAAPRDVAAVLAPGHRPAVYRPQGWLSPVVLVDGRIAGTWGHELRRSALAVDVTPFAALAGDVRAGVQAEAERLAAFLGASDCEVSGA
jgi:hypothetical protein